MHFINDNDFIYLSACFSLEADMYLVSAVDQRHECVSSRSVCPAAKTTNETNNSDSQFFS